MRPTDGLGLGRKKGGGLRLVTRTPSPGRGRRREGEDPRSTAYSVGRQCIAILVYVRTGIHGLDANRAVGGWEKGEQGGVQRYARGE